MEPQRFQEQFLSFLAKLPADSLARRLGAAEEAEISFFMDLCPLQDSFRYRARYYGLKIALWLIDEAGELDRGRLSELTRRLGEGFHLIGPRREGDALIFGHLLSSLKFLEEVPECAVWLKKFSPPLCHKKAEQAIRETLRQDAESEPIRRLEPFHIRRAVLAAWLTLLRQSTGSCFATAPAILIQKNYPLRLFKDLNELLSTGRLKRVFGGREYMVPMSLESGSGDLQKPLSSVESLPFCPGLIRAFEAGGALRKEAPLSDKILELRRLFEQQAPEAGTVEQGIRSVLLYKAGLTEEDLKDEAYLARIQMTPLLARQSAVYYQKPSERSQKVAVWKRNFEQACSAFQSFTECALLRTWEYTIASFCDVKIEFARWNLYIGLGFAHDEKGGVGDFLYQTIDLVLQKANEEAAQYHKEYEQALNAARSGESLLSNSTSDAQRSQLRGELTAAVHAANATLEARDRAAARAEAISGFFSSLMKQYDEKLQEYFQEIFDPSLVGEEAHLYDDSLAGFRLVYKHGRTDASQWTLVRSGEEYIHSLRDFFSAVESDLTVPPQLDRSLVSDITTALIQFIQSSEFLESATARSQAKGRRSPWDYFSGGTMETLLQAYCSKEGGFKESQAIPRSEEQLLHFLQREKKGAPLLMRSPTHAFLYDPDLLSSNANEAIEACRKYFAKMQFDEAMQEHIAHRLSERLAAAEKPLFLHLFRQRQTAGTIAEFRFHLIESLSALKDPRIKNRISWVDAILFENSPLLPLSRAKEALRVLLGEGARRGSLVDRFEIFLKELEGSYFGPAEIHQMALSALLHATRNPVSVQDWNREIADAMRAFEFLAPAPILFADTNWSGWLFGFLPNPATGELELWRFNRIGTRGTPMADWKEWVNGSNSSPWVVLSNPSEYPPAFS